MGEIESKTKEMWAWWDNERQKFYHVYESKFQVEMCSVDGFKYSTENGLGKITKVKIQPVSSPDSA